MSVNLLARVSGSGAFHFKGIDFWANDVAAFDIDLKPFKVGSNNFGPLSNRAASRVVTVKFTDVGVMSAAHLKVLYPYLNPRLGDYNTPVRTVSSVDTTLGNLVSNGHGQITGTGVRFGVLAGGVMPTGVTANTTYYLWCNADGNTVQIYDTEAHALASDGTSVLTGQIIPSVAGSGTLRFIVNTPLTIITQDGVKLVIWNAAITEQPDLNLGPTQSPLGSITIEGYTLHGQAWSDANSIYTYSEGNSLTTVPPDQTQIPTVQYTVDWETRLTLTGTPNTSTNVLPLANHGLAVATPVTVDNDSPGGTLPSGLTAGTTYYVIAPDANNLKLATTSGNASAGTAISLGTTGSGTIDVIPTALQVLGMTPRDVVKVSHKVTWSEVKSQNGIDCRRIISAESSADFVPTNVDYGVLLAAIGIQGGTAGPGQALPSANLDIYGPNETPFVRIYGGTLQNTPAKFGVDADRVDGLKFLSDTRQFRGGVQLPFAYVGVAAPAI
jgi:hypothetical protein